MDSIYRFLAHLYDLDCVWDVYDTDEYNSDDNNTGFDISVGNNYDTITNKYHVLKNFKNRFCCGRKKTMNKDKKITFATSAIDFYGVDISSCDDL